MQRIAREYYEKLYTKKLDNREEKDEYLETCDLLKLNQERKIRTDQFPAMKLNHLSKNSQKPKSGQTASQVKFCKYLEKS